MDLPLCMSRGGLAKKDLPFNVGMRRCDRDATGVLPKALPEPFCKSFFRKKSVAYAYGVVVASHMCMICTSASLYN